MPRWAEVRAWHPPVQPTPVHFSSLGSIPFCQKELFLSLLWSKKEESRDHRIECGDECLVQLPGYTWCQSQVGPAVLDTGKVTLCFSGIPLESLFCYRILRNALHWFSSISTFLAFQEEWCDILGLFQPGILCCSSLFQLVKKKWNFECNPLLLVSFLFPPHLVYSSFRISASWKGWF